MRFRNLKKILAATMVTTMVLGNYGTVLANTGEIFSEDDVPGNNTNNSTSDEENYWDSYEHEIQNHFVYDVCKKIWCPVDDYESEDNYGIKTHYEEFSLAEELPLESSNYVTIYEQFPGDNNKYNIVTPNWDPREGTTSYDLYQPDIISDEYYDEGDFSDWDRRWYDKWVEVPTAPGVVTRINHLEDHDAAWAYENGSIESYTPYLKGIDMSFWRYDDYFIEHLEKIEKTAAISGFQCLIQSQRNCVEIGAATGKYLAVLYDKTGKAIDSRVIQTDGTPSCTFSGLKPGKYTVKWQSEHYSQTYTKNIFYTEAVEYVKESGRLLNTYSGYTTTTDEYEDAGSYWQEDKTDEYDLSGGGELCIVPGGWSNTYERVK